jgi:hypothetical protein
MGFVVDKVALGQIFLRAVLVIVIILSFHDTHLSSRTGTMGPSRPLYQDTHSIPTAIGL